MTSGASPEILLHGLSMFLGQVRGSLADPSAQFRARIAEHLLLSLALEHQVGEGHDRAAIERLSAALDVDPPTPGSAIDARKARAALESAAVARIRDVGVSDALRDAIVAGLVDELTVTNPRFDPDPNLP